MEFLANIKLTRDANKWKHGTTVVQQGSRQCLINNPYLTCTKLPQTFRVPHTLQCILTISSAIMGTLLMGSIQCENLRRSVGPFIVSRQEVIIKAQTDSILKKCSGTCNKYEVHYSTQCLMLRRWPPASPFNTWGCRVGFCLCSFVSACCNNNTNCILEVWQIN